MIFRLDEDVFVNGMKVNLDRILNCKSKNIIYFAQCSVCQAKKADLAIELNTSKENVLLEDSYVGQTVSESHVRINGHRKCFKASICSFVI